MFNTIRNKKIAMLGFAFKKDGDTRETPTVASGAGSSRTARGRDLHPKVSEEQIAMDMEGLTDNITCYKSAMEALDGAHAVTVMTEWDEFKAYDWKKIYGVMQKPALCSTGGTSSITRASRRSLSCTRWKPSIRSSSPPRGRDA